jgi:hypothetical protein
LLTPSNRNWRQRAESLIRSVQLQPRRARGAIDIHEGDKVDAAALKDLIRAAVALNLKGKQI